MAETFFGPAASVEVREAAHDIAAEQRPVDLVVAVEAFHGRPDATDVVKAWHKPLVVVSGDCDGVVSVEKSMGIAAMAPHGELHIVPNCGHFVNMEQPAIFNAILRDVVRSVEATSA